MLFSSFEFVLFFIPITLALFHYLPTKPIYILIAASLFFYGWYNPAYLPLILSSIVVNYWFSHNIYRKNFLSYGVAFNLLLLGFFKYTNFIIDNVNYIFEFHINIHKIELPLAISFFTFQQIAFLVSAYRNKKPETNFSNYFLCVLFFPHLIAGPIVNYKDLMPQVNNLSHKLKSENLAIGITVFSLGLFKKVILADSIAPYANIVFDSAANGSILSCLEAWGGALAYTFQLYFDFSGYSDMAIGLSILFGIRLPINFNSPYKASGIIEFWHRWHITLSTFLRDHLYIPLGGNKTGRIHQFINIMIVMLLGGLWHGANWTFVLWGGLHGIYLFINHTWRYVFNNRSSTYKAPLKILPKPLSWTITFICLVIGWVLFRANNITTAFSILKSMFVFETGTANLNIMNSPLINWQSFMPLLGLAFFIVLLMPNIPYFMRQYYHGIDNIEVDRSMIKLKWQPNMFYVSAISILTISALLGMVVLEKIEFLYFDF
jgi:alginate O-acetyltransferase complex protein AlgI